MPQRWVFGNEGDVQFEDQRVITDRRIGDAVPLLAWLLPRRIRRAREQKWCSRARLGGASGWAIHEIVTLSGSEGSPPPRSFAVSAAQDDGRTR